MTANINGLNRIQKWLPYFYNSFNLTFINQRYNIKCQKPTTHVQEYQQLQQLVYTTPYKFDHSTISKPILLPQLSDLEIKEIKQRDLQYIFQRHLSWIKGYIFFIIQTYQQPITVVYRFRKNALALKSELSEVKKYVQFISFDQLTEKAAKNTILMLEPYLIKEEDLAKFAIGKVLSIASRLEYFKLCFETKMKHLDFQLIYPNLYQNIELNMKTSTYKKKIPPQRKITVYFEDYDDEQKENGPTKTVNQESPQKHDEYLQETCAEMDKLQTSKNIPKIQDEAKSKPISFNMFSIQINPIHPSRPVSKKKRNKAMHLK